MATLTAQTPIGTLIDQLRALRVAVGVYVMPAGTAVYQCRRSEHEHDAPAVADLYPVDDRDDVHLGVCLPCAIEIVGEEDIRAIDVKRIESPTILDDEPVPASKVTVLDRDGRLVTLEKVGVEVEVAAFGRNVLALDLATPAGVAAARVLRDALDAAIKDVAA
jgi:hypothetical protein